MHIPDGYISPSTSVAAFAAVTPFWIVAGRRVRSAMQAALAPRLGLFAAFSFVVMMFNIPLAGGTSGHAVGGALMALALGPWAAVLGISAALCIQAFFFADGGIAALGANCLNLAVILPFVAWHVFHALRRGRLSGPWAAGLAGWFGLMAAALAVSIELGIQPLLFRGANGAPLYCPYGLRAALFAMIPSHALIAAPVEGLIAGLVWAYLARTQPGLLVTAERPGGRYRLWPAWATLFALALATPIGLLASGAAWGEWASTEVKGALGYAPAGMARLEASRLGAMFPDYAVQGLGARGGYLVAAFLGLFLVAALTWGLARLVRSGERAQATQGSDDHAGPL